MKILEIVLLRKYSVGLVYNIYQKEFSWGFTYKTATKLIKNVYPTFEELKEYYDSKLVEMKGVLLQKEIDLCEKLFNKIISKYPKVKPYTMKKAKKFANENGREIIVDILNLLEKQNKQ